MENHYSINFILTLQKILVTSISNFIKVVMLLLSSYTALAADKDYVVIDSAYGHLVSKTSISSFILLQHTERQEEYLLRLVDINGGGKCETKLNFGIFVQKKFVDLDGDGYKDVLIKTLSGKPLDIALIYRDGCLKQISAEPNQFLGEALKLKNSFLFDYKGLGCSDSVWETTLFSIQSDKLFPCLEIIYDKCQNEQITFNLVKTVKQQTLTEEQKNILRNFHSKKDMKTLMRFWKSISLGL